MQELNESYDQERCLVESVQELECINQKIAALSLRKEELVQVIIGALGHYHEGQKTYDYGKWKIEVKTPFTYCLNKKLYESGDINIPEEFNPIKQSISYSIDKRLCDQYLQYAPPPVKDALIELIDKKPGKASVLVKEYAL